MKGSEFAFDYIHLLCYKFFEINPNHYGLYIDWINNKRTTKSPINKKDNKWFQYAVTVALNYEKIKKDPQTITKIKPFLNEHNWEGINFS